VATVCQDKEISIREDERRHEETKMKIETDKARLEYEMNDPVRLEARQKAADR
jgi:hypothetical protein